jgi:hypothetical protein
MKFKNKMKVICSEWKPLDRMQWVVFFSNLDLWSWSTISGKLVQSVRGLEKWECPIKKGLGHRRPDKQTVCTSFCTHPYWRGHASDSHISEVAKQMIDLYRGLREWFRLFLEKKSARLKQG